MSTFHIHINGIVQGVGFRPLAYQLAKNMGFKGYAKNGNDGIHIFINASLEDANNYFYRIIENAPTHARIIASSLHEVSPVLFDDFLIVVEDDGTKKNVLISPDLAICEQCRKELHDKNNLRYRYPFVTCTHCGPRYSIVQTLPYERQDTTMQKFAMCRHCTAEYKNVEDRRFFSQTNSCGDCGVSLVLQEIGPSLLSRDTPIILSSIKKFLEQGKIIAVKGIGGYILLCDANNGEAISLLRIRKRRPSKPFAVLIPGLETANQFLDINPEEKKLLQSAEAPIVLLKQKPDASRLLKTENIAPGLDRLGVMLPYSPLLDLIAHDFAKPLIATSANISGSPIIYEDEMAMSELFYIADYIVSNDRDIVVPEDDSVVQITPYTRHQIVLRRSRGYAPSYLHYKPVTKEVVVAAGAFLKSTFTIASNGNIFISQFLGSGESYESQQMYRHTLSHCLEMYDSTPQIIIADKHPQYFTRRYAEELSEKYGAELKLVQHHEAHFAAVLAENNLMESPEPLLGVVWDGTGWGNDGNIWGGEFFKYDEKMISRCAHLDYFPVIAGDKTAIEPRLSLLCTIYPQSSSYDLLRGKFTSNEWKNYQSLLANAKLFSSSMGRLFDAVASLLNLCDKQTYEGEAAMYLQAMAEDWVYKNGFSIEGSYFMEEGDGNTISTSAFMENVIRDVKTRQPKNYIAAKFHHSLVCLIGKVSNKMRIKNICFSGGVFQNALLVDWICARYNNKYQLYFHKHLSSNDENISFGQLAYFDNNLSSEGLGLESLKSLEKTSKLQAV
ncbi:MAG: carbamoyltransferase HypF [Ginsengibacter sp.]